VALLIAGLVAYLPSLWGVFTFDDYPWILDNPGLQPAAFNFLQRRPVTLLTFAANLHFGGAHPVGFHVFNIALHLANGALVYVLIGRTMPKTANAAALAAIGAALFLLHPAQSGAVTYISGRATSLMTFWVLVAHLAALRSQEVGSRRWMAVSLAAFVLAVGSKETALVYPALWLGWLLLAQGMPAARALRIAAPHLLASLALVFAMLAHPGYRALIAEGVDAGKLGVTTTGQWEQRLGMGFCFNDEKLREDSCIARRVESISGLARFLAWPAAISIDPGRRAIEGFDWLTVALVAGVAWAALRTRPGAMAAGAAWVVVALLPTSIVFVRSDPVSDRLLYLPMVGIALIAAALVARVAARRVAVAAVGSVLLVLAVLTWQRNTQYASETALWEDAVAKNPAHARAHVNLGYGYELQGDVGKAEAQYRAALQLRPDLRGAQRGLERIRLKQKRGE
jgi:tetratricopeptide (TPR) repeat protein